MNLKNLFSGTGLVISLTFPASMLTSCIGYVEPSRTVYVEDDYVYYPEYEVYYSQRHHDYIYVEGSTWTRRSSPNVSISVLSSSQSVGMDFHDSPERHHSNVVHKYPKHGRDHGNEKDHDGDRGKGHD